MQDIFVYGVALGPGDPELITLKALKTLQLVDKIYAPGSVSRDGELKSHARSIIGQLDIDISKVEVFHISMRFDRTETEALYQQVYESIKIDIRNGKKVAFVSEGDVSFYSTFGYLIPRLNNDSIDFKMIPGVPAFIQAGSTLGIPLTSQSNSLKVLAAVKEFDEVDDAIETSGTVVIMKFSTIKDRLVPYLQEKYSNITVRYVEKLGTEEEFITSDIEEINRRKKTYFSILIIQK
ncbi:precorrin-2 C(20)-methyltransferase [Prolixibacteraceae bacterium]|nr:precorrin-2 C(20)-methyltransferase [Prolixibacteraceae bacterium]